MRLTKWVPLVVIGIWCLNQSPASAADGFEARWNLTERGEARSFASWLEINRDGSGWRGMFLHRGGHPMPADVEIRDDSLRVTMRPPEGAPARPDARFPTLEGRLRGNEIQGTGSDRRGDTFTWTGVRAPDRHEGSHREVSWGEPIELFNGRDLSGWIPVEKDRENNWKAVDGILHSDQSGANLRTVDEFRDFKLRLEWMIPPGSNSGVYLRGRYETQVADDYGKEPYSRGVGGVYGQLTPSVNPARPAGEWNTVEATLIGYRLTLVVNGQTTIDGEYIPGITGGALDSNEAAPGPIMLQGDHGPVSYRNIVLTPAR